MRWKVKMKIKELLPLKVYLFESRSDLFFFFFFLVLFVNAIFLV